MLRSVCSRSSYERSRRREEAAAAAAGAVEAGAAAAGGRLSLEQEALLEVEFNKVKTLHQTDLALLAAELALTEQQVQVWYRRRVACWRRDQGLSDCFGQI